MFCSGQAWFRVFLQKPFLDIWMPFVQRRLIRRYFSHGDQPSPIRVTRYCLSWRSPQEPLILSPTIRAILSRQILSVSVL